MMKIYYIHSSQRVRWLLHSELTPQGRHPESPSPFGGNQGISYNKAQCQPAEIPRLPWQFNNRIHGN